MKFPIPPTALQQHIAVLGKTGSGKTSTAKLIIEHVVKEGARVCILDPIKSDWWGLISSADGRRPGLPFHILGGPHGHVPLHAGAGKAIAEVVGSGALPLSIIDMAEFGPGGQTRFFTDFAPVLLRRNRGVLYLVMEEAHMFAPKERSGLEGENFAVHYAKLIATAGRTKGLRLIVCTQRTQSLHNAVLGSCDTMIAHRFTAPADADPVVKWFKGNASKAATDTVQTSLSSLKTGEAWMCSGEAQIFERTLFPRIATYDNTQTPDGNDERATVRTAQVDLEKLRSIIGDAVAEAQANDPVELKKRIQTLEKQLSTSAAASEPWITQEQFVSEINGAKEAAYECGKQEGSQIGFQAGVCRAFTEIEALAERMVKSLPMPESADPGIQVSPQTTLRELSDKAFDAGARVAIEMKPINKPAQRSTSNLPKAERAFLTVLAQRRDQGKSTTRNQVAIFAGYSVTSRHIDNVLATLRASQWATGGGDDIQITDKGLHALGDYEPMPTGADLRAYWLREAGGKAEREMLQVAISAYPKSLTRDQIAERAGYSVTSRHVDNTLARLRSLELIRGPGTAICASDDLF